MTEGQKIIKYLAIAFAVFLIISIFSAIFWTISSVSILLGLSKENSVNMENMQVIATDTNVNNLKIELNFTNLEIKRGSEFRVETNNSKISYKNKNGNVLIEEKNNFLNFGDMEKTILVIYIPDNMETLNKVEIESGANTAIIKDLQLKEFDFEQGAGEVSLENLTVSGNANIDGGTGKMNVLSSTLNNLDLSLGVGEFSFNGKLTGNNEIDAGIGNVNITLTDGLENYRIKASKGIGDVKIGNDRIASNTTYGNGTTLIDVDGGIGSILIN